MKKLLTAFFILWITAAHSQIYQPSVPHDYGTQWNRAKALLVQHIPVLADTLSVHSSDTSAQIGIYNGIIYWHYGFWRPFGSGGGSGGSSFVITSTQTLDGTQNLLTIPHTLSVEPTRIEVTVDDEQGIPTFVQPYADNTNVYIQLSTGRHCTCEYKIRVTP